MDVRICPNCGHQNRSGAKFCAQCGTPLPPARLQPTIQAQEPAPTLPEASSPPPINCPHCGHPNKAEQGSCQNCGRDMRTAPPNLPAEAAKSGKRTSRRVYWIVGAILLGLIIICASVILLIPRLIDRINPFDDIQDLISPIETAIGPIDLDSIPQQIETAIPLDLTGLPLDIPSEFPIEIPTLSPVTVPGLDIELPRLTDEEEIEIGREAAAEFESENRISRDPALVQRVEQIGSALVPNSQRRNIEYTFKVVDTGEVNAFALPGGYIYITRGMVEFVEQDHELAGVLGHEIAHVALRHSARLIENLAAAQAAIDLVTASSEELASIYQDNSTRLAINAVTQIVVNGWGRENELDADQHGTIYMARSGYNPYKIIDLFERMGAQETVPGDPLALMFATHPPFPDRIRRVRETIQEYRLG